MTMVSAVAGTTQHPSATGPTSVGYRYDGEALRQGLMVNGGTTRQTCDTAGTLPSMTRYRRTCSL